MPLSEISSSFPVFSWNSSNGSATAEQTVAACQALENEGRCILFSYLVWDDMVDTLRKLQTALSVSWDEEYASYENTRMTKADSSLTAARFNSFRYNIDIIWRPGWPWALPSCPSWLQRNSRSFLGREDVRGYSQYKEQCDRVYGWYLLELVRKMNILIRLMRGDDIAVEMDYSRTMQTLKCASAGLFEAVLVSIQSASGSAKAAHMTAVEALSLFAKRSDQAVSVAKLEPAQVLSLAYSFHSGSASFYSMRVAAAACMDYQRRIRSKTGMAQLVIATAIAVMYQQMHGSSQETSMITADIMEVGGEEENASAETAAADTVGINTVAVRHADQSAAEATVITLRADQILSLNSAAESSTESTSDLNTVETEKLTSLHHLVFACEAHLLPASVVGVSCRNEIGTEAAANLHFDAEEDPADWFDPVQTGTNLYIRQTYEDPDQAGTNLSIISAAIIGGE